MTNVIDMMKHKNKIKLSKLAPNKTKIKHGCPNCRHPLANLYLFMDDDKHFDEILIICENCQFKLLEGLSFEQD